MIKIFFIVTAVWASILMGGISAERSLHTLQGNDHCDPEYPKPSVDPTCAPTSVPTFSPTSFPTVVPTAKPTSAPTADPTSSPSFDPTFVPTTKPTSAPTQHPISTLYPFGVQNSVTVADLDRYGCSECYLKIYATATTSDDIIHCTSPNLFVGGRATGSSTFKLGAFDTSAVILTQTFLNTPHLSNGVYWYFTPSNSFGFSRNPLIEQNEADTLSIDGDARLSWHLDVGVGGFRLGSIPPDLNDATNYEKAIYNCPA